MSYSRPSEGSTPKSRISQYVEKKLLFYSQKPIPGELYMVGGGLVAFYQVSKGALAYRRFGIANEALKINAPNLDHVLWRAGLREPSDVALAMQVRGQFMRSVCTRASCYVVAWWLFITAMDRGYLGSFRLP